jgi:hypothetical protein
MIDTWTKQSPGGNAVAYMIEGNSEVGFIFSAQMEGWDIVVSTGDLKSPRENKLKRTSLTMWLESRDGSRGNELGKRCTEVLSRSSAESSVSAKWTQTRMPNGWPENT